MLEVRFAIVLKFIGLYILLLQLEALKKYAELNLNIKFSEGLAYIFKYNTFFMLFTKI